jgi:hypothetical protein
LRCCFDDDSEAKESLCLFRQISRCSILSSNFYSFSIAMAAMGTPPMELMYFDIAGKAEAIRIAAAYGKMPLTDTRLSRDDFDALKADGTLPVRLRLYPTPEIDLS